LIVPEGGSDRPAILSFWPPFPPARPRDTSDFVSKNGRPALGPAVLHPLYGKMGTGYPHKLVCRRKCGKIK
jgi:hypothetical protein